MYTYVTIQYYDDYEQSSHENSEYETEFDDTISKVSLSRYMHVCMSM